MLSIVMTVTVDMEDHNAREYQEAFLAKHPTDSIAKSAIRDHVEEWSQGDLARGTLGEYATITVRAHTTMTR